MCLSNIELTHVLDRELHDLAQPLASLQCRLEIGNMLGDEPSLREAVDGALQDMLRLTAALSRMRAIVVSASEGV